MKRFAPLAVREVVLGLASGALGALLLQFVASAEATRFLKLRIPASITPAIKKAPDLRILIIIVAAALFLILIPHIKVLLERVYRSYLTGMITGILPVWFLLVLFFFLPQAHWSVKRFLIFTAIGLLSVVVSWLIVKRQSASSTDFSIAVPKSGSVADESATHREVTFDLPIHDWSEDRLDRGPLVRSVAELILRDKAPVLAIVGSLGEGKTSLLNLLAASLKSRRDLIIVPFSSWLPGDEKTLMFSLFATISERIKEQYLIFAVSNELKRFARLLAGAVPKVGESLKQFLEAPSQVEQLRNLKRSLAELPVQVVVLVDEVDRMDRAELLLLLKAMRGVVDLPNITYVCAFDRNVAVRLISAEDPSYGEFYLEKFFPVQIALPRTDQELLSRIFDRKLEVICETFNLLKDEQERKAFNEALLPLWHGSIKRVLTNFRRMTLFFNALRMSLAPVSAEVNLFDMMVLQLVKMISEETYEFIYGNGPLFYYPSWKIGLWLERLSVDDEKEVDIRNKRLDEFFGSLSVPVRTRVTELMSVIFPTVDQSLRDSRFSFRAQSEEDAETKKRIYHPDYFPRYFIHQVPFNLFGREEMKNFITELNAQNRTEQVVAKFRQVMGSLARNPWKRWSFLDALAKDCAQIGDVQAEALVTAVATISDSLEDDVLGLGEWGRARAILFVATRRFSGTAKLRNLLVSAIREAASDAFAADIVRYSTTMRKQNNIITDWQNVDEPAIRMAFAERMRTRYMVGSQQEFPYRRDDLSSFLLWVGISDEDRMRETNFFCDRFHRYPVERGRFLGWTLPRDVVYEDDPLVMVGKLFPVDELFASIRQYGEETWIEQDRKSVQWFMQLMEQRASGGVAASDP